MIAANLFSKQKPYSSPYRSPPIVQWIGFIVLLTLLLWMLIIFDLSRLRAASFGQSRTQLSNLSNVYAEEVQTSVFLADYVLKDLRDNWKGDSMKFAAIIQHRQIDLDPSVAYHVSILDEKGNLVFSSLDGSPKPVNLSDLQHFKFQQHNYGDKLFISEPLIGHISNRWAIQFTRPLRKPTGAFSGIIVLSVSPEYFSRFHQSIDLGRNSSIALVRLDGKILSRSPDDGKVLVSSIKNAPFLEAGTTKNGSFHRPSEVDQVNRLFAWKIIDELNLAVVIGQSNEAILQHYFRARTLYLWVGSVLTVLLLLVGFFRLKSLHKQAADAAALFSMESALHRAQKMEAVGQLTGGVAHDFNNVLQVISSNLEMLALQCKDNAPMAQRTRNALQAVDRGSKLASQLLTFARRQPLQTSVLNIGKRLQSIDDLIHGIVGSGIHTEIEFTDNLHNVSIDPSLFENVVLNLAANARDAMHGKGTLTFQLTNVTVEATNQDKFYGIQAGQYVRLTVTDTGEGMTPEVIDRAFEPFFTTKPEGMGTGLGLSMAFGFVNQSNGYIFIESQLQRGTSIYIFLPASLELESVETVFQHQTVKGGTETVLLVDDDKEVQSTVSAMLQDLGYHVFTALNAEDAILIIEKEKSVSVLLTDLVMPGGMDGLELGMLVRDHFPKVQVILTSGYSYDVLKEKRQLDKSIYILRKPYRRDELDGAIRTVRK